MSPFSYYQHAAIAQIMGRFRRRLGRRRWIERSRNQKRWHRRAYRRIEVRGNASANPFTACFLIHAHLKVTQA